jgi:Cu(I)/Ag(I) efflux system membrane fusion protein
MKRALLVCSVLVGLVVVGFLIRDYFVGAKSPPTQATKPKQLWTCLMHPQIIQDHPGLCPICKMPLTPLNSPAPRGELLREANSSGPAVTIDPTVVQNMGVRTAQVTRGPLQKTIRTVGVLSIAQPAQVDISPRINGWIEKLYANQEGMHVLKGERLFDIYSPELQVAEQELIGAIAASNSLNSNSPDATKTESENLIASARRKLALWGVADEDIETIAKSNRAPRTVPFRSPADGEIEDEMIVDGSAIQSGMKIMRIEDHSKLWLAAQVYEQQLAMVKLGQEMQATFDSVPGDVSGSIDFIYPHLDPATRTVTVRATIDNSDHRLKPGMYATVNIITKPIDDALLVPREAVIDTGTRQFAFVAESAGHFDPRNVHMGLSGDDDQVQILDGLNVGETVVTSGQFLLDVTSRTTEALQKIRPDLQSK